MNEITSKSVDCQAQPVNRDRLVEPDIGHLNTREAAHRILGRPSEGLVKLEYLVSFLKLTPQELVQENDSLFDQLRCIAEKSLAVQTQARDLLGLRDKDAIKQRDLLLEALGLGLGFPELDKLRQCYEETRKYEFMVLGVFQSGEELTELEEKLKKEGILPNSAIKELLDLKRGILERLNAGLLSLLSKTTLSIEDMATVSSILEQANAARCKLNHFRYVCDIRDNFRWLHVLYGFLKQEVKSLDKLQDLMGRINETPVTNSISFEQIKRGLVSYIGELGEKGDQAFSRIAVEPLKDLQLVDNNVQELLDIIAASKWYVAAKQIINERSMTVELLEELQQTSPALEVKVFQEMKMKMSTLRHDLETLEERLTAFEEQLRQFIHTMDSNSISCSDSQQRLEGMNGYWKSEEDFLKKKLFCFSEVDKLARYRCCKGLLAVINCVSMMNLKGWVKKEALDEVGYVLKTREESRLRQLSAVGMLIDMLNDRKIIEEFVSMVRVRSREENIDDKIDIRLARKYAGMMQNEDSYVDYSDELVQIQPFLEAYTRWETKVSHLLYRYDINLMERDLQTGNHSSVAQFREEVRLVIKEYSKILFNSDIVIKLDGVDWSLDALDFLYGKRRKRYEWEVLIKRGREVTEVVGHMYKRIKHELEAADRLKIAGHDIYKEKVSFRTIEKLKSKIEESRIDMHEEVMFVRERIELEEEISAKVKTVLNNECKYRICDIEKLAEEVKQSGIDFEELGKKLEFTLQLCKSFISASKEMNKNPREIKRAKHIYQSLPLTSSSFSSILKQLEDEERVLDIINESLETDSLDWDALIRLDAAMSVIKYYDVSRIKAFLIKQKVSILMLQPVNGEVITYPYHLFKVLKNECSHILKTSEDDQELMVCLGFIEQQCAEAENYLEKLACSKTSANLENASKRIGAIDLRNEVEDLQAKLRLRLSKMQETRPNTREIPMVRLGSSKNKRFDLKITITPQKRERDAPRDEQKERPKELMGQNRQSASNGQLDMPSIRNHMLNNLKFLIQRNNFINELDSETTKIASKVEREVFSKSLDGSYVTKMSKVIRLFEAIVKMKRITKLITRKEYSADMILYLADKRVDVLIHIENDKNALIQVLKNAHQTSIRKRRPTLHSHRDMYETRRLSGKHHFDESDRTNKMEDTIKVADKLVEKLQVSLDSINQQKDINVISEDSDTEEPHRGRHLRDARKRSPDLRGQLAAGNPRSYDRLVPAVDQPAWSIYKGTLNFEYRSTFNTETRLDYSDLITLEDKAKVCSFPSLPDKLELRGPVENQELSAHLDKMIKNSSNSFSYLLGFLKSNDNQESLHRLVSKTKTAFVSKCTPYSKLFLFHKASFDKDWNSPSTEKVFHRKADYYWLLVYNVLSCSKAGASLAKIDPYIVYGTLGSAAETHREDRPRLALTELNGGKREPSSDHLSNLHALAYRHPQKQPGLAKPQALARANPIDAARQTHSGNSLLDALKSRDDSLKPAHRNYSTTIGLEGFQLESTAQLQQRPLAGTHAGQRQAEQQTKPQADYQEPFSRTRVNGAGLASYQSKQTDDREEPRTRPFAKQLHYSKIGPTGRVSPGFTDGTAELTANYASDAMLEERLPGQLGSMLPVSAVTPGYNPTGSDPILKSRDKKKQLLTQHSFLKKKKQKLNSSFHTSGSIQEIDVSSYEDNSARKKRKTKKKRRVGDAYVDRWTGPATDATAEQH